MSQPTQKTGNGDQPPAHFNEDGSETSNEGLAEVSSHLSAKPLLLASLASSALHSSAPAKAQVAESATSLVLILPATSVDWSQLVARRLSGENSKGAQPTATVRRVEKHMDPSGRVEAGTPNVVVTLLEFE